MRSVQEIARTTQARYEAGLQVDYEQYPVAGSRYGNNSQVARKMPLPVLEPGMLVMIKQMRGALGPHRDHHFAMGARGPFIVVESKGDSVLVQGAMGAQKWQNRANCLPLRT